MPLYLNTEHKAGFVFQLTHFLKAQRERQPSSFGLSRSTSPDDPDWAVEGESVYSKDETSSMMEVGENNVFAMPESENKF